MKTQPAAPLNAHGLNWLFISSYNSLFDHLIEKPIISWKVTKWVRKDYSFSCVQGKTLNKLLREKSDVTNSNWTVFPFLWWWQIPNTVPVTVATQGIVLQKSVVWSIIDRIFPNFFRHMKIVFRRTLASLRSTAHIVILYASVQRHSQRYWRSGANNGRYFSTLITTFRVIKNFVLWSSCSIVVLNKHDCLKIWLSPILL